MDRKTSRNDELLHALVERSNHADLVATVSKLLLLGLDRQLDEHFDHLYDDEKDSTPTWIDSDFV